MTKDKYGLGDSTILKIKSVLSSFNEISEAILYGSRAKGNYRTGSDIDLCLKGENLSTGIILKLDNSLDELNLPYTFDLSIYDKIDNKDFIDHINRVGIALYCRVRPSS